MHVMNILFKVHRTLKSIQDKTNKIILSIKLFKIDIKLYNFNRNKKNMKTHMNSLYLK